jgi:hypothetical protein
MPFKDVPPASECSSQDVFRQLLLGSLVHGSLYPLPMPRVWHEPPISQHAASDSLDNNTGGHVPGSERAPGNRTGLVPWLFPQKVSEYFTAYCRRILHILITGKHI